MSQVIDGRANVGACGFRGERRRIVRHSRAEQRLDRRPDAIDDGAQIGRLVALWLPQLFQRGSHGAALRVSEHDGQPRLEPLGRKLDATHLRRRDDIARHANDEQVAKALAKDQLRRNARSRGHGLGSCAPPLRDETAPVNPDVYCKRGLSRLSEGPPTAQSSIAVEA